MAKRGDNTGLTRVAATCGSIALGLGILALAGWAFQYLPLAGAGIRYIPMAPSTAVLFIALGGSVLMLSSVSRGVWARGVAAAASLVVYVLSGLLLIQLITATTIGLEELFFQPRKTISGTPIGRISPVTAATFIFAAAALFLLARRNPARRAGAAVGVAVALIGAVVEMGYAFGSPLLYGGKIIPVAVTTGLAFVFLGTGLVALAGPSVWPLRALVGDKVGARILRSFLPLIGLSILTMAWLNTIPVLRGSGPLDASILVVLVVPVTAVIAGRLAQTIDREVDKADKRRLESEEALRRRDMTVRRAYVDIFYAVTGGKLIILAYDEIVAALGRPLTGFFTVAGYKGLHGARDAIEASFNGLLVEDKQAGNLIIAADEALTNAVKHAGGGRFRLYEQGTTAQVVVSDSGPGIDFTLLPKATLMAGFSTAHSLGMGFSVMLDLCDRVMLCTEPGRTIVVLEVNGMRAARRAA